MGFAVDADAYKRFMGRYSRPLARLASTPSPGRPAPASPTAEPDAPDG